MLIVDRSADAGLRGNYAACTFIPKGHLMGELRIH